MKLKLRKWIIEIFLIIDKQYLKRYDFHFAIYENEK